MKRVNGGTRISHARKQAMSIVEVLIALSISAMLLTAVAAAFGASAQVIEHNDNFFRASQAARVSINQIVSEVRRAQVVQPVSDTKRLDLFTYAGQDRSYIYDNVNKVLKLYLDGNTTTGYVLAHDVTSCTFQTDTRNDASGTHVVRVSIAIEVQVGKNEMRLTGSATVRQAQIYQ